MNMHTFGNGRFLTCRKLVANNQYHYKHSLTIKALRRDHPGRRAFLISISLFRRDRKTALISQPPFSDERIWAESSLSSS